MNKFHIYGEFGQTDAYLADRLDECGTIGYPRTGNHGEDWPVRTSQRGVFYESVKLGMFSAFRLGQGLYDDRLGILEKMDCPIHIDLLRCGSDYGRAGREEGSGMSYDEFARKYFSDMFDFAIAHPGRVMLCVIGEYDSSCPWPRDVMFRTREEGREFFFNHMKNGKISKCDPAVVYQELEKRNLTPADVGLMIHGAALFAIHYYFETGYPYVEIERGIGLSCNMQTSLAYLRGAWKQYGRKTSWGIDYSTHHPATCQLTWYDQQRRRRGGRSESLIMRSCMDSWLSGADYILEESSDYQYWIYKADGSFTLSPLGEVMLKFNRFALEKAPERGETIAPVAIMLDYNNGYEGSARFDRTPQVWGNRYPLGSADLHISNTFEIFFPGHRLSNTDGELFACNDLPYSSKEEFEQMMKDQVDMRPYERGFLTPGTVGECFDVINDHAALDNLKEYGMLILSGTAAPQGELLLEYMEQGGKVFCAYNQLPKQLVEKFNISELPSLECDHGFEEGLRYLFTKLDIPGSEILYRNSSGIPLVFRISCGAGALYLCAVPMGQDLPAGTLMPCWKEVLLAEAAKLYPVHVSRPGLSLIVNRKENGYLVGAFNNGAEPWKGDISLPEAGKVSAIWPEKMAISEKTEVFSAEIAPFDVRLFDIEL